MNLVVFLIVGLIAGWLAGFLSRGAGYGALGNIALGVIGAFVGGLLLDALDLAVTTSSTFVNAVVTSLIGALVVILVARAIR